MTIFILVCAFLVVLFIAVCQAYDAGANHALKELRAGRTSFIHEEEKWRKESDDWDKYFNGF